MTLLDVQGITYSYGNNIAIRDVSLSIQEGEVVTVIGPNGAGKTTTANSIVGQLTPESGSISFDGRDITDKDPHEGVAMGMSLVPEERLIFPWMTVKENLRVPYSSVDRDVSFTSALEEIFELFPRLEERMQQRAGTMSGGEQQMLSMARALITDPKLLILDEPSLGLMPTLVTSVFETINEISKQGMTVLLIEQNVQTSLQNSDRGYVLEQGEIVLEDESEALLENEKVMETYLGMTDQTSD